MRALESPLPARELTENNDEFVGKTRMRRKDETRVTGSEGKHEIRRLKRELSET